MAKTMMISNYAYEELKKLKESNKSFSDVIVDLLIKKEARTGYNLKKHFGLLKDDKEYGKLKKKSKSGWNKWQKRYA